MRIAVTAAAVCLSIVGLSAAEDAGAAIKKFTNIPAQSLGSALQMLAQQREFQIVYLSDSVDSLQTSGAVGELTSDEALTRLLSGTGLEFRHLDEKTVTILSQPLPIAGANALREGEGNGTSGPLRLSLAQGENPSTGTGEGGAQREGEGSTENTKNPDSPSTESEVSKQNEVVVTGTRIRGATPVGSPAYDISSQELEQAGHGSTEEILRNIPQNVGDTASPQVALIGSSGQSNYSLGTGANLRGLGSQSTLTLINGRRVAPSGSGNFTDLSTVPISAIERVEVLLDGASAIYGSDAIGGVLNLVLRDRYEGLEASYRHGWTSEGGGEEKRAAITVGGDAGPVSALLGLEYLDQEGILANERDFGGSPPAPQSLLPDQERQSIFARGSVDFTPELQLALTGLYADRSTKSVSFDQFSGNAPFSVTRDNEEYSLTADLMWSVGKDWRLDLFGGHSQSDIRSTGLFSTLAETATSRMLELSADGAVVQLPGGTARVALGIGHRTEELESDANFFPLTSSRKIEYAFIEFAVPLLAPGNDIPLVRALELSLAGRYEKYSDFGSTENPKIGLLWNVVKGLAVRASYGTSFRAPSFFDLDESGTAANLIFDLADTAGTTRSILLFGGNSELQPERADTLTAGVEWNATQSFRMSAGYYDIDYRDRIAAVEGSIFPSLTDPTLAPIVTRRGSLSDAEFNALVLTELQRPPVFGCGAPVGPNGFCTENPANFSAVVDRRTLNLGVVQTSGFDLNLEYFDETQMGDIALRFSTTFIDEFTRQITEVAPGSEIQDTFGAPLSLSLHAGASFTRDALTLAANVNYDTDYRDFQGVASQRIDSWTTVDLYGSYTFNRSSAPDDRGLRISMSVRNLFNEDPPTVPNNLNLFAVGYDPANANPIGRQFAFEVRYAW